MTQINMLDQLDGYIGWKDKHGRYMGCNKQFAAIMQLKHTDEIIGLHDRDLLDYDDETYKFHRNNDKAVLNGKTIKLFHQSHYPYDGGKFYFVKKPLKAHNSIIGIIFHCQQIIDASQSKVNSANPHRLSNRELECLHYLLQANTSVEIAAITGLSSRTVDAYIDNIKNKMGCSNRAEVIIKAIKIYQR